MVCLRAQVVAGAALVAGVVGVSVGPAQAQHTGGDGGSVTSGPTNFKVVREENVNGSTTPEVGSLPASHAGGKGAAIPQAPDAPTCEAGSLFKCLPAPACTLPDGTLLMLFDGEVHSDIGPSQPCSPKHARDPSWSSVVLRAFRKVPLPAPQLSIQPPKGKTLVGLETIFSTKAEPFTRTLTLLGRTVTLKIEPSSFLWHHGDGTSQTTDWAGKAWDHDSPDIDDYLTHVYEHTGAVRPSVEVTWSAQFRVGGGAWRSVNGTVTRAGAPVPLEVLEGQPVLNSY